jgi:hypothetical protein
MRSLGAQGARPTTTQKRHSYRPTVEILEDRRLLTIVAPGPVTLPGVDVSSYQGAKGFRPRRAARFAGAISFPINSGARFVTCRAHFRLRTCRGVVSQSVADTDEQPETAMRTITLHNGIAIPCFDSSWTDEDAIIERCPTWLPGMDWETEAFRSQRIETVEAEWVFTPRRRLAAPSGTLRPSAQAAGPRQSPASVTLRSRSHRAA